MRYRIAVFDPELLKVVETHLINDKQARLFFGLYVGREKGTGPNKTPFRMQWTNAKKMAERWGFEAKEHLCYYAIDMKDILGENQDYSVKLSQADRSSKTEGTAGPLVGSASLAGAADIHCRTP